MSDGPTQQLFPHQRSNPTANIEDAWKTSNILSLSTTYPLANPSTPELLLHYMSSHSEEVPMEESLENLHLHMEMDYYGEDLLDNSEDEDFLRNIFQQPASETETESDHSFCAVQNITSSSDASVLPPNSSKRPRTYILSFDNSTVVPATPEPNINNNSSPLPLKRAFHTSPFSQLKKPNQVAKKPRTSSQTIDHIMAERRRRQELTQRFIALSATIPGLSKTDKASVLRAAIEYMKELQERVQELEKQDKRRSSEAVVLVKKPDPNEDTTTTSNCSILPEMEARVLGKEVLIEIHCEKENGIELKILDHLENLHLSVTGSSVLPFGNSALCITITAQMGGAYQMTVNDLMKNLRQVLSKSHVLLRDSDPY